MFPTSARYEPQINRSSLVPLQSCSSALRSPRSTLRQPVATSLCSILTGNHWPTPYRLSPPSTQALCFSLWLSPTLLISSPIPLHTQTSRSSSLPFKPVRLLCAPLAAFSGQASYYLLRSPPTILLPTLSHCTHRSAKPPRSPSSPSACSALPSQRPPALAVSAPCSPCSTLRQPSAVLGRPHSPA